MRIIRGLESYPSDAPASVVALGTFDGVHLAHQKILDVAAARARASGARAVVCTFDPHPLVVLRPTQAPLPITALAERLALIAEHAIDLAVVIPFTEGFSLLEPEDFIERALLRTLRAREIVVGFNHTFGRGARGDAGMLESLAGRLGFVAHVVPPLTVGGTIVSSSAIREALGAGDLGAARQALGRPYAIAGIVTHGAGRGRQLGFPTANIRVDRPPLVPTGVYAGYASIDGTGPPATRHKCVVNVGYRPTFEGDRLWIEAYLIDFSADIYGHRIRVDFMGRIRGEEKFPDVESLCRQIERDVATAASVL
jgi:riboflavin kinase/FMN adenylyltransferase